MSSSDYSTALRTGIYTVLNGNVTVSSKTYKIYKDPVGGATNRTYIAIGPIIDNEDGSKDGFVYTGSVTVETFDMSQAINPTRDLSESVNNKVRSLLKTSKGSTFTVSGYTLTVFRHGGSTRLTEQLKDKRTAYRIIDIYEYIIQ